MSWESRIPGMRQRFQDLTDRLADPAVLNDRDTLRKVAQEQSELAPVIEVAGRLDRVRSQRLEARAMMEQGEDPELAEMAEAELAELDAEETRLAGELRSLLLPKDPLADRAAVVEIRAGTGGDEAGLFAADLYRMYSRFADTQGWRLELVDLSEGERGAYKEVVFIVLGAERVRRPALGVRGASRAAGAGHGEPGPDPHVGGDGGGAARGGGCGRGDP